MYRVCFEGAEPFERVYATLEQACDAVRASGGDIEVLPGADDVFWLCCRNVNDSDSEVVARIHLEPPTEHSPPAKATDQNVPGVPASNARELEPAPESAERSIPSSGEPEVRSRRTPTG